MPIYEYVCQGCEDRFEIKQGFNDAPISSCSKCGEAVTKIISAPAIMFKGSGWYVTDYSDKLKPPTQAEGGDKAPDGKKDEKEQKATKEATPAPAATEASSGSSSPSHAPSGTSSTGSASAPASSSASSSSSTASSKS